MSTKRLSIEKRIRILEMIRDGEIRIPKLTDKGWISKTQKEWDAIENAGVVQLGRHARLRT